MSSRGYTVLGWAVWQLAKFRLKHNKSKLGAAATVLGVLAIGVLAAKAADDD